MPKVRVETSTYARTNRFFESRQESHMHRFVLRCSRRGRLAFAAFVVSLLAAGAVTFAAATAAASGPLPSVPPKAGGGSTETPGSICQFGACYDYVAGRQYAWYATGASARLWRGRPKLDPTQPESHSLQELSIQSASDFGDIVEIGWTVDRSLNGDNAPHLFVFHWVNGVPTCYNGCGFVQTSTRIVPGMQLPSGGYSTFQIEHVGTRWELSLDGAMFGYFPDSLWADPFLRDLLFIQAFGEVAAILPTSYCNDMGTGAYADSPASSAVADFTLLGPTVSEENLFLPGFALATTPEWYTLDRTTPTGYRLGGPGSGHC